LIQQLPTLLGDKHKPLPKDSYLAGGAHNVGVTQEQVGVPLVGAGAVAVEIVLELKHGSAWSDEAQESEEEEAAHLVSAVESAPSDKTAG